VDGNADGNGDGGGGGAAGDGGDGGDGDGDGYVSIFFSNYCFPNFTGCWQRRPFTSDIASIGSHYVCFFGACCPLCKRCFVLLVSLQSNRCR